MQVLVFVTDDGRSAEGTGPTLIVEASPVATLPPNPRSLEWRYFATMESEDLMFGSEGFRMRQNLDRGKPHISNRLIR
jgi:hypothetical protein